MFLRTSLIALGATILLGTPLAAQEGLGFRYAFGDQSYTGDIGDAIGRGTDAEFSILVPFAGFRLGGGANWVSLDTEGEDTSWNQLRFHALVGRAFPISDRIRPYAEARWVFRRLRPEDDRFFGGEERLLRDFAPTASGFEGVLGTEIVMSPRWSIDVSTAWSPFTLSEDLSPEGFPDIDSGAAWRIHAGISWWPLNGRRVGPGAAGTLDGAPNAADAWGQQTNFGMAAAETFLGNFLPWTFNEIVPGRAALKISQLSPRSFHRNIEEGWKWDDNAFGVNHFAHPFQGSIYFNSARGNGFGYWSSLGFATAGSFNWECCGETHLMSINDWVNTAVGGAAVGEVLYRTSSMILDNRATGVERVFRELAAFAVAPTRGFARMVSGNAFRVYDNPENPLDWRPNDVVTRIAVGNRASGSKKTGKNGSLREDLPSHGFVDVAVRSGSRAALDRGRPFDYFDARLQVNFVRGRGLGELRIDGNLWHRPLSDGPDVSSKLIVMQNFEYTDNTAFEYGGQSVGLQYHQSRTGETSSLEWSVGANWMLLGGVDSELSFLSDVAGIRERYREYDFGVGPGADVGAAWSRHGRPVLEGSYRFQYQHTLNGSSVRDFGSSHQLHIVRLRALAPIRIAGFSVGADYERFHRRSHFDLNEVGTVNHWSHQFQVYVDWSPGA